MIAILAAVIAALVVAQNTALFETTFTLSASGDAIATIDASCERCDWAIRGREAALLRVAIDGRYSQHVMLTRGETASPYRVLLGALASGTHRLSITLDRTGTARAINRTIVASVDVAPVDPQSPDALALSMAPIVHARPNTIGRFTDVPLLMWYEIVPTTRGRQLRYSVIFSNEDGGTPTDRLMATWGRTTDIEYVYGVELDAAGRVIAEEYQGPRHEVPPFNGTHEGRHPRLWVSTDNNMVRDAGRVKTRYAPAPARFDLTKASREIVMDANPWTYRVMAAEMAREGKIVPNAGAGSNSIPDVRRFVFVEACTDLENAALSFGVRVRGRGASTWFDSDRGRAEFRIVRAGCFRGAVPLPEGAGALDAVRFRAFTKPRKASDPPAPPPRVRLTRVNAVFQLGDDFTPGRSLLSWSGDRDLAIDGEGVTIDVAGVKGSPAVR